MKTPNKNVSTGKVNGKKLKDTSSAVAATKPSKRFVEDDDDEFDTSFDEINDFEDFNDFDEEEDY